MGRVRQPEQRADWTTTALSILETAADLTVRLGLIVAGGVFAWLMFGVLSGQIFEIPASEVDRVRANVEQLIGYATAAAWVSVALLVIRQKEEQVELHFGIAVIGVFLWFGFPLLIQFMQGNRMGQSNAAISTAIDGFAIAGRGLLWILVVPALRFVMRAIRLRPLQSKQDQEVAKARLKREPPKGIKPRGKPNFLSPCWHLPYCRDYLVEMCPAYKARKRCWKFGGGCFCDQGMIESMLSGLAGAGRRRERAYTEAEISARTGVARQRTGRTPCRSCYIYLEHEKLKHDVLSPLCYPVTAAIMFFIYEPVIRRAWFSGQGWVISMWNKLAFTNKLDPNQGFGMDSGAEVVGYMIGFIVGMYLLLALLRLCELWCFKWKL